MIRMILLVAMSLGFVGATGCGDSACEAASSKICAKACSCTSGEECRFGEGGSFVSFDNQSDCVGFLQFACGQGDTGGVDFAACETDLETATCENNALVMPASCSAPEEDDERTTGPSSDDDDEENPAPRG